MRAATSIPKSRRNLSYAMAFVLLMAAFFVGFYYYFIPLNREMLHRESFNNLRRISNNIIGRNNDFHKLYSENLGAKNPTRLFIKNKIPGIRQTVPYPTQIKKIEQADGKAILYELQGTDFVYALKKDKNLLTVNLPVHELMDPIIASNGNEIFSGYILIADSQVIYKSMDFGLNPGIAVDSLIGRNKKNIANICEVILEDQEFKLFHYPFKVGDILFLICGLEKKKDYISRLQTMSPGFIYTVVIVAVLLLIGMPILRFYIMGADEIVKFSDLMYFILSLFGGMALVTLIIIHILLLFGADRQAKRNLDLLSDSVSTSLKHEIVQAYNTLVKYDTIVRNYKRSRLRDSVISVRLSEYISNPLTPKPEYRYFDRVSWAKLATGKQTIKAEGSSKAESKLNEVDDRDYYLQVKENRAFPLPLPGNPDSTFGIEAINNRQNGEFRILISKASASSGYLAAISTNMYSVKESILPPGYGFIIIDKSGQILLQSGIQQKLKENIFNTLPKPEKLTQVVMSKKSKFYSRISFNGRYYSFNVEPMTGLPFYIITHYDNRAVIPAFLRILTFALFYCCLATLICTLLWMIFFYRKYYSHHMVHDPVRIFAWATPNKRHLLFYYVGSIYLVAHVGIIGCRFLKVRENYESDIEVLQIALLSPINAISVLVLLGCISRNRLNYKGVGCLVIQGILVLLMTIKYHQGYIQPAALIYQSISTAIAIAFALLAYFKNGMAGNWKAINDRLDKKKYTVAYTRFLILILIFFAAVPPGICTWYAHNNEIEQTIVKQQLSMAEEIINRKKTIAAFARHNDRIKTPNTELNDRWLHKGIYEINRDNIYTSSWRKNIPDIHPADEMYIEVAEGISFKNTRPEDYPALPSRSADSTWNWHNDQNCVCLSYKLPSRGSFIDSTDTILNISSTLPKRFEFISRVEVILLLAAIIGALIWCLYSLLQSVSHHIFLLNYIKPYIAENAGQGTSTAPNTDDEDEIDHIDDYERALANDKQKHKKLYDYYWKESTDKEKYLMYDFAHDGLMNFKNPTEIYHLIERKLFQVDTENDRIRFFKPGFRAFILEKKGTEEISRLQKMHQVNSAWRSFKIPFYLIIFAIATFIFFTQENTFQKILGLLGGFVTILNVMGRFVASKSTTHPQPGETT